MEGWPVSFGFPTVAVPIRLKDSFSICKKLSSKPYRFISLNKLFWFDPLPLESLVKMSTSLK